MAIYLGRPTNYVSTDRLRVMPRIFQARAFKVAGSAGGQ